ncbi:MAG: hypothetical protein M1823_008750, partial [Watsoniomyces obsoletus]
MQLVMQANQTLRIANFCISLSHDFETKMTTAIACVENESQPGNDHDERTESIERRLKHVIAPTELNRGLWAHPTFLPVIFARHYADEMRVSRAILREDVSRINRRLGIATARNFRPEELADDWPENLDF